MWLPFLGAKCLWRWGKGEEVCALKRKCFHNQGSVGCVDTYMSTCVYVYVCVCVQIRFIIIPGNLPNNTMK